jgi:hypothetical protein
VEFLRGWNPRSFCNAACPFHQPVPRNPHLPSFRFSPYFNRGAARLDLLLHRGYGSADSTETGRSQPGDGRRSLWRSPLPSGPEIVLPEREKP